MRVKYRNSISWQNVGGTVFAVNEKTGEMYYFDDVATDFWMQIGLNGDVNKMLQELADTYQISSKDITDDLEEFISFLDEEQLVIKDEG